MKRLLVGAGLAAIVLASFLILRTSAVSSQQQPVRPLPEIEVDGQAAAERLGRAIQFQTVSHQDPSKSDPTQFLAFHRYLEEALPKVHETLEREVVSDFSLLYKWEGTDAGLNPILLMAHQDVVPISGTEQDWQHPPFSGQVAEGYVWGRGTLDDKSGVLGTLEAAELLLEAGFQPKRTIYFAFGHDEEIGGMGGAFQLASILESRNIQLEFVLDEGGFLVDGRLIGLPGKTLALVGIAEKGILDLELSVRTEGGHSSAPPRNTSVGLLSQAVTKLEDNQLPARLDNIPTRHFLDYISPEMPFWSRLPIVNLWLFRPLLESMLSRSSTMNALIRTTTAVTIFNAGEKSNVLPTEAVAVVNFRIVPGDSIDSVTDHVRETIHDDRVHIQQLQGHNPSSTSETLSPSFRLIGETIRQLGAGNEIIVAPYLVPGGTDARRGR